MFKKARKAKPYDRRTRCDCGVEFQRTHPLQTLCVPCGEAIEHDANVEMFGGDADYLEAAGLADKIGNK